MERSVEVGVGESRRAAIDLGAGGQTPHKRRLV